MPVTQSYQNYFYNSRKLYEFRIKIANVDLANKQVIEAIKNALNTYEVETITAPKRLPIQEHRDFGKLGPCEVQVIDVALNYPTICEQVRQLVINRAGVPNYCVCVETLNQAAQEDAVNATILEQGVDGPIIDNPQLQDVPGGQEVAGQRRVDSLLKDLASRPQMSRAYDVAGGDATKEKDTNSLPQGDKGPMSTQNYVYRKPNGSK